MWIAYPVRFPSQVRQTLSLRLRKSNVVVNFTFDLVLEGVGISIVNKRMNEMIYVSFRGLELSFADSTTNQTLRAICKWIQVDNQLPGAVFPILLYPTDLSKDLKELEIRPNFQAFVVMLKDQGKLLCPSPTIALLIPAF